jgi:hypothetical protein
MCKYSQTVKDTVATERTSITELTRIHDGAEGLIHPDPPDPR